MMVRRLFLKAVRPTSYTACCRTTRRWLSANLGLQQPPSRVRLREWCPANLNRARTSVAQTG